MTGLIEEPAFREHLQQHPLPPCTGLTTEDDIDREAIFITEAISQIAASLVPRKRRLSTGQPMVDEGNQEQGYAGPEEPPKEPSTLSG